MDRTPWSLQLPQGKGLVDPLFLHDLALELHMTVGEMCSKMSAHELAVMWPAYYARKQVIAKREAEEEQRREDRRKRGFED